MKKLITIIMAAVMTGMLFCTGCGSMERADYEAVLLDYLSNRYPDDTFTVSSDQPDLGGKYADYCSVNFCSEKYPDAKIVARREKTNWKYSFEDNYMRYYMQDKLEEYMHNTAEEYFGECKVFVDFSIYHCLPESFPTDATAEDFLKHESLFNFDVIISPENITYGKARKGYKELEIALEKEFEEYSCGYIDVCVYYALDAETFEKTESYDDSTGEDAIGNKDNYRYVGRIGVIGMAR